MGSIPSIEETKTPKETARKNRTKNIELSVMDVDRRSPEFYDHNSFGLPPHASQAEDTRSVDSDYVMKSDLFVYQKIRDTVTFAIKKYKSGGVYKG